MDTQETDQVDLIGMAYENARSEGVQLKKYLKVAAPAKVNLYLGVAARGADGMHPVQNVMHALLLHDVVYMRCLSAFDYAVEMGTLYTPEWEAHTPGLQIHLTCSAVGSLPALDVPPEKNIAYKAVVALREALGRDEDEVLDIHLEKHIPHQAGLGGGSADAAAALVGAARLWGVAADDPLVEQVAQTLGSDVAFFLRGGCALFDGAGEHFVRALTPRKGSVVLIKPEVGLSTAAVYGAFDEAPTFPSADQESALEQAQCAADVPLFNGLAPTAGVLAPELERVRTWALAQEGVTDVLLTGSGSCTYAVCASDTAAYALAVEAQKQGWWAMATYFQNLRAAVM